MTKARLLGADLRGAILSGVDLPSVYLNKARIDLALAVTFARAHGLIVE
jgi:uncharacterized protein YjbI with pentapeptide repeats